MRDNRIIDSWNKAEPDREAEERIWKGILAQTGRRRAVHWKPLAGAACLVLLAGIFLFQRMRLPDLFDWKEYEHVDQPGRQPGPEVTVPTVQEGTKQGGTGTETADNGDLSDEIKGLPVDNFKLSEMEGQAAMDRIVFWSFLHVFEAHTESIVIVKVTDTQPVPASDNYRSEGQRSEVKVLETVWGKAVPETMSLNQYLYGGCTGDEATNLLRKDGVYLLPLTKYQEAYYLVGDLDLLFEIDEEGRIWSHSDHADFNRFDGEGYQSVTEEIIRITQDEDRMLAASEFGMVMRGRQLLEVTVLSEGREEENEFGYAEIAYTAHVERALSGGELDGELSLRSYADEELPLSVGNRYLVFVDHYDEKHYISLNMMARVGEDGRIQKPEGERNPFAEYEGYTGEEIAALAARVTEFLKTYQE